MSAKFNFSLGYIAEFLGGQLKGDAEYFVRSLASLDRATASDISFLVKGKHSDSVSACSAGALIISPDNVDSFPGNKIIVDDPYQAFAKISALFDPRVKVAKGIHPTAIVAESAQIASSACIGAHSCIGENTVIGENCEVYPGTVVADNCSIGNECVIFQNVSIYSNVTIGKGVRIHAGAVIGSDGFGFAPTSEGWTKIHQLGGVVIGDRVEIGAATAIDRGALEDTVIGNDVIIDNQVHIAHNVHVGEGSAIAGCVGIAGSAKLGKRCIIAGAVSINGHISIADGTQFNGGTVVTKGTTEPGVYASGTPLLDVASWRRSSIHYKKLDEYASRIKALEKKLANEADCKKS